uniref:SMP-LTD domain-containing protein n=1 Tax=Globodera rostochiensis TaxID=31243 RepID=A0A914HRT4_GLORO
MLYVRFYAFLMKSFRKVGPNDSGGVMSERLLVWINETVLNELLDQFQWDFKEKIPLNSSKLPYETRDFFANICPQCIFIFNVSADGLPNVTIEDGSILVKIHNRIAAEVENPTIGESGQKKTAIDLTLNLKELKIFPKQLKPVVEELLQDMIKDDVWPAVKRGIEPLIYVEGVELPPHCGIDPISTQLHFGHSKFGASATLNIKEISLNQGHQSARTRRLPIAKDTSHYSTGA